MKSSICHTFIGFQRCTKIPINTDSLRVHSKCSTSLYPFYSQNCLHILSKVFRSIAKHPNSRNEVNRMWIPKNSKELLDHLQSPNFNHITSIKSFDFRPFTQPFLTRNLKADSQLSRTLLFTKMEIADTNFWFLVAKDLFCQGTLRFEKQVHWRWHH